MSCSLFFDAHPVAGDAQAACRILPPRTYRTLHHPLDPDPPATFSTAFPRLDLSRYCYAPHCNGLHATLTTDTNNDDSTLMTTRRPRKFRSTAAPYLRPRLQPTATADARCPQCTRSRSYHCSFRGLPSWFFSQPAAPRYLTLTSIRCIYPNSSRTAYICTVLHLFIRSYRSSSAHILRLALHCSAIKLQPVPTCHCPYSPAHLLSLLHARIYCFDSVSIPLLIRI